MAVIIDDDEREDKDDTEESMDHPTTGNRQLEELAHHLEETKIEMQRKGETFVPMRSSNNNNANEIGLDALAPSLAKPVSASREMFERAKETLVLSGKTKITTVCFSNKSGVVGVRAEGKIEANEHIFEHSWREQRAPFGGMCMVAIEKLKFEYNVKEVYLKLLKERFYSDGRKQAVPTSAQTFLKLAPEQFVRGGEEDLANAKYDCISDTYYALRDIQPGEEILIAKKDALAAKPGSVAITCDSESVENELLSWLVEEELSLIHI